jgi:hypothetical protein
MANLYVCDRCGESTKKRAKFKRTSRRWWLQEALYGYSRGEYDLCINCGKELEEFLKGRPVMTLADANEFDRLKRLLAEEKEVTARWERLASEQKETIKTPS